MSEIITLKSFPYDSLETDGTYDREYEAKIFRDYFSKFLSTGVYLGTYKNYGENSLKVILDGNLSIKVTKGAGLIEGIDFELEEDKIIALERPIAGEKVYSIIIKADNTLSTRATQLYVKDNGDLQRDENVYEICIAQVTVRATANISENDIVDTRLDKNLCGIVNSLITVDGKELYEKFENYIDTVTENLVRKDQDIVINGTITDESGKSLSTNDFNNEYKTKLDNLKNTVIIDNLINTSSDSALSANMGNILNDIKQNIIKTGKDEPSAEKLEEGDIYLQYFD